MTRLLVALVSVRGQHGSSSLGYAYHHRTLGIEAGGCESYLFSLMSGLHVVFHLPTYVSMPSFMNDMRDQ